MTPGARAQAAIDLLAALFTAGPGRGKPADAVANAFFRARRYIGAKDRGAVAGVVYGVLRRRAQLDWWLARARAAAGLAPVSPDARARVIAHLALADGWTAERIAAAFDGGRFRPSGVNPHERAVLALLDGSTLNHPEQPLDVRGNFPAWLEPELTRRFGARIEAELAALAEPASLDLRVNRLKATREEASGLLAAEGVRALPTPLSPVGLRVEGRPPLAATSVFREGLVDGQDEGCACGARRFL